MTTQPTPAQLATWRVKFESRYDLSQLGTVYDRYLHQDVREAWGNYVAAREDDLEENEQATKDARKQALEDALAIVKNENKFGDIEFEIKELLK